MATNIQSKFFCGPGSDSDTETTSSSEESSVEQRSSDASDSDSGSEKGGYDPDSRFLVDDDGSGSESDENRVVRSAKDKCREDLSEVCDELRNKIKINDWAAIQTVFDKLGKQLEKTMKVLEVNTPPMRYLRILVELEDYVGETWSNREARKKMSVGNGKALNTMRHRVLKHNKDYEELMEKYRANPVDTDVESEVTEESDSVSTGSSSDDEVVRKPKKKDTILTMDPKDVTYELVEEKLADILASRGKKGADQNEQVEMLQYMVNVACGPAQKLSVLSHLISCIFDMNSSMSTHQKVPQWKHCVKYIFDILDILNENPQIKLEEDKEKVPERTEQPGDDEEVTVWCLIVPSVERLDDELFKSLQVIDPHTTEYLDRLRDEPYFLVLATVVANYLVRMEDLVALSRIRLRLIEHYYYKTNTVYAAMRQLTLQRQEDALLGDKAKKGKNHLL